MSNILISTATRKRAADLSRSPIVGRLVAIALCEAIGIAGAATTDSGNSPWYRSLRKPRFQPPPSVFAPVWTVLYAMMGLALFELWQERRRPAGASALRAFGLQLALNGIWTPVFFGLHSLSGGLAIIIALWGTLATTLTQAARVSDRAGALLLPYFAWVSFAAILNGAVVMLNPRRDAILRRFA